MRMIMAVVVLGMAAVGCSKNEQADSGNTDQGIAASDAWLRIVDDARYEDSWEQACAYFKGVVDKNQWVRQISGVRGPLGPVVSRKVSTAKYKTMLPGAPDGEYVVIQYETTFQNKAGAIETVTPMRDADGVYRVSGYYIR